MLHVLFKENEKAVAAADHFIAFMDRDPQMEKASPAAHRQFMFNKLYYLNVIVELGAGR